MIVVTDTSVVLNLCFLGRENLLTSLFGTVLAPPAVRTEFQRLALVDPRFIGLTFPGFIQVIPPLQTAPSLRSTKRLHAGEIEALSLAVEQQVSAVLMDERAGRDAAARLGLRCIGVLGILIQAKAQNLVPLVRPLLDHLQSGAFFWIAPTLRQQILQSVGE